MIDLRTPIACAAGGLAAGFLAGAWTGWTESEARAQARAASVREASERKARALAQRQAAVTLAAAERAARAEAEIRTRTITLVKETPRYVTPADDARCPVPDGFVRLHDAAAAGVVPDAAAEPDASARAVALSEVSAAVTGNYGLCHETGERLKGLQAWVKEQAEAAR